MGRDKEAGCGKGREAPRIAAPAWRGRKRPPRKPPNERIAMKEKIYDAFHLAAASYAHLVEEADRQAALLARTGPLGEEERDAMRSYDEAFLVRFTYNSAAIEGSTLTLADTELVLEGEFMPSGDKRLADVFAAKGIAEGCEFSERALAEGVPVSESLIRDIHERTALDCQPRTRGMYRTSAVYIRGSETVPADASMVREYMSDLLFAWEASDEHPIVRAAAFHAMFENIHPFQDGNGRAGRIVLNHMLQSSGYPPIAIKASLRAEYLTALEDWQVRGEPAHLIESVARCVSEECAARREGIEQTRCATTALTPSERASEARAAAESQGKLSPEAQRESRAASATSGPRL